MLDARGLREAVRAGEHTGPDRRPRARLHPGQPRRAPAGRRLRLPALLRAEPQALPGARRHRRRLPRARADGPGRRPAHRRPALPDLARRRARRGAGGRERALARRPRRLPDRLLVHVRARAARPRACRSATSSRASTCRCTAPRIDCTPAGRFSGPLVVSMRPMTPPQAIRATQVTSRYAPVHGAPVHVGEPAAIGIDDLGAPDYGDPVEVRDGELPVFWACGVTPQAVAVASPARADDHPRARAHVRDRRARRDDGDALRGSRTSRATGQGRAEPPPSRHRTRYAGRDPPEPVVSPPRAATCPRTPAPPHRRPRTRAGSPPPPPAAGRAGGAGPRRRSAGRRCRAGSRARRAARPAARGRTSRSSRPRTSSSSPRSTPHRTTPCSHASRSTTSSPCVRQTASRLAVLPPPT